MLRKVEKRGVNETARRLKQLVGQIFRFAIVTGRAKFRAACRLGLEGLVSKRRDRPYQVGRSKHW